jgi:hypothetical protein
MLLAAWDKYHHAQTQLPFRFAAGKFADFVIDTIDVVSQLVAHFSGKGGENAHPSVILTELDRRAKVFGRPIPPIQNPPGE